jgi:NAD(P)-dependent dehydrogenase (short-subunit alcohol dehydrogenase family)
MTLHRLDGTTVVVTGAAGAFGRAISRRLDAEGARVALWDVRGEDVRRLADELGERALAVEVDITVSSAVDAAHATTRDALGPVTALVNNAGISRAAAPWAETDAGWDEMLAINATGAFYCVRAVLGDMREQRYGKIVNIASLAAQQGRPTTSPSYAASKGALLGMTVSLARNLGELGICVNAINPGFIRTEIHDQFTDEEVARLASDIPLHRRGRRGEHGVPDDIAAAVAFLVSPDADFVTGEYLSVNGGSRTGS